MVTAKDFQKASDYPHACKDHRGALRVGAAVGTGYDTDDRVEGLVGCLRRPRTLRRKTEGVGAAAEHLAGIGDIDSDDLEGAKVPPLTPSRVGFAHWQRPRP